MRILVALALLGAFGGGIGGCLGGERAATTATVAPTTPPTAGRLACAPEIERPPCTRGVRLGAAYPFVLSTHCGIRDAYFDGRPWVADPVLSDGSDNPPAGWDNPAQVGTMTLVGRTRALFRAGPLVAAFKPATPGYRSELCQ